MLFIRTVEGKAF